MPSPTDRARDAARNLPAPVREALKRGRKRYRSARYRLRERISPTSLSSGDVAEALRACGLGGGDACFFQAAMSPFGGFEDGPDTVLEGLEAVVGSDGLVAMPAFTLARPAVEHLAADPVFDVRQTPSRMGAISEAFRLADGTLRSVHPTHSVSAVGAEAEDLVAGHEHALTPFGDGTPFMRLVERDALQVYFGCGTAPMTMYHPYECVRVPPFPLDVFGPQVFDARCIAGDGSEIRVRTLAHNPRFLAGRIDSNPVIQAIYRSAILESGGVSYQLGRGEIIAIRLSAMFEMYERLIGRGVTIYDEELPGVQPDLPPQDRVDV